MFVFFASPRAIAPVTVCFHSLEVKKVPLNAFPFASFSQSLAFF
jgi:hypothetical protein